MEQPPPSGREYLFCNQGASVSRFKPPLEQQCCRGRAFWVSFIHCFTVWICPPRLLPCPPYSDTHLLCLAGCQYQRLNDRQIASVFHWLFPGPGSHSVSIHAVGVINLVLRMQPCSRVLEGISLSPPVSPTESIGAPSDHYLLFRHAQTIAGAI